MTKVLLLTYECYITCIELLLSNYYCQMSIIELSKPGIRPHPQAPVSAPRLLPTLPKPPSKPRLPEQAKSKVLLSNYDYQAIVVELLVLNFWIFTISRKS